MSCSRARELLLVEGRPVWLTEHVRECATCRREARIVVAETAILRRAWDDLPLDPGFREAVIERLEPR